MVTLGRGLQSSSYCRHRGGVWGRKKIKGAERYEKNVPRKKKKKKETKKKKGVERDKYEITRQGVQQRNEGQTGR